MNTEQKKFLWGVVNIGQQTEGGDKNSNWAAWNRRGLVPCVYNANDYWHKYSEDHDMMEELGCNSMRITIEWSRIELEEGVFDEDALKHYRDVLQDLHRRNIKAVVGLWHWSVPMWFEEKYGMHSREVVELFTRFASYICDELGELIDYIVVLNEPSVYISTSYLHGTRPPFYKNHIKAVRVFINLIKIHMGVYKLWKKKYPETSVSSTFLYNHEVERDDSFLQNFYLNMKRFLQNGFMIHVLKNHSDYIGINYYTSDSFYFGKSGGKLGLHGVNNWHSPDVWKKFPKGLYHVLLKMKKYNKPILILENGKPTNLGGDDTDRQEFLKESIQYMKNAIKDGVDVRGYFHYSLCDSYEWDSGYDFKFGLVEINRKTGNRTKRNSHNIYKYIIDREG